LPRVAAPCLLDSDVLAELVARSRSHSLEYRHVIRAKIVLDWEAAKTISQSAADLKVGTSAVKKWRSRFARLGLDGLLDEPRSGRPARISSQTRAKVIEIACSKPSGGYTGWSQRRIAKACGVSQSRVRDILAEADLRPHKTEHWCGKPSDPEFEPKMLEIVGLYMDPPENALVLCVDEKTGIQALDRTQPVLDMRPGKPKRLTATYTRHGTVALVAALAVHSGKVTARTIERNDAEHFLTFLKALYRANPGKHLHVILDNLAVHKTPAINEWLKRRRRISLHFTPTYSSWLNQVEIWFGILTREVLKGGVWRSKEELQKQLMAYVRTYSSERAHPFSWTYTGKPCKE
jgi:putative transposase